MTVPRPENGRAEWFRLFNECADGTISETDRDALAALLKDNREAREAWFLFQDLQTGLVEWAGRATEEPAEPKTLTDPPGKPSSPARKWTWRGVALIAVAACLAGIYFGIPRPHHETSVAHVAKLDNANWVKTPLMVGDSLAIGRRIELSSGQARIEFGSGAVVTLTGPAIFEPTSANSGQLIIGELKASAETPASRDFTIQTPTARVVVSDSQFVATASADGQSRVDVVAGRAEIVIDGTRRQLQVGDALSLEPGQRQIMARVESGADSRFASIESPFDLEPIVKPRAFAADKNDPPAVALLDPKGKQLPGSPEAVLVEEGEIRGLRVDLGKSMAIDKVNTYSGRGRPNDRIRATKKFSLYGYDGDEPPGVDGPLTNAGWVLLARVDADGSGDTDRRTGQHASSISAATGSIGRYRYLLWQFANQGKRNDNIRYSQIDVYAEP